MTSFKVLIVDDESSVREGVSFGLKRHYQVEVCATGEEALEAIHRAPPDLVLLDIGLPGIDGIETLKQIKQIDSRIMVIMITAYEDIDTVISAMKHGAHDYITKPIRMDALKFSINNALETVKLRKEIQILQERCIRENLPCFIGESNAIQDVMQVVEKVAKSPDTPVLITGESGTGKELIASAIHYKSPHFRGPFLALNCPAIPHHLVESELFGYEKGAFSGASPTGKAGLIEVADGGTLFLDEIGELLPEVQAKLLRFLEDGEFFRIGGTQIRKVRTRIVSATNQDLGRLIEEQRFRIDLYYRLAVIRVEVPTLNERRDDILPIAKYFLHEYSEKHGKPFQTMSPEVETYLCNHRWKGNIRELRNLIERGVLIGEGPVLTLSALGLGSNGASAGPETCIEFDGSLRFPELPPTGIDLGAMEDHYIREACRLADGNDRKAAKLLNLSYFAFRYRKKKVFEGSE
ncbi:MAG: sigma-54 dependent transcriptional regulator [Desulfobacterales bacterium]|jgi:DNA-binding NtrC family response regulator